MERNLASSPKTPTLSTPYVWEKWQDFLNRFDLSKRYPSFIDNLQHGFDAGIPAITSTLAPLNHPSVVQYSNQLLSIVQREFAQCRYFGPYSEAQVIDLIGPFQSSPLSIIPKPGKPGKFRLIQNFSHPYTSTQGRVSVNSHIDPARYPCTWGTFANVALIISRLPEGSEAATRDVKEAYRTIPIHPSQWPGMVVRLPGPNNFAIDTRDAFGLSSGAGLYGTVADVGVEIMRAMGMGPITKWVDDHLFFRIPRASLQTYNETRQDAAAVIRQSQGRTHQNGRIWFRGNLLPDDRFEEYSEDMTLPLQDLASCSPRAPHDGVFAYSMEDIDDLSQKLGIPWERDKDQPFSSKVTYIGFDWDLKEKTVALSEKKKRKYLEVVKEWQRCRTHDLQEAQKLHGKLLHACLVITRGKAYLRSIEAFIAIFHDKPFLKRTPPKNLYKDLQWWREVLGASTTPQRQLPGLRPVADIGAFSDASSTIGIGIVVGERWRAWRLLPGWRTEERDIGWAEAVGFLFLCTAVTEIHKKADHRVYGDNKGVVEGWWNGRSRNSPTNDIFKLVHEISHRQGINFFTRYVPTDLNPADGPSRGVYGNRDLLLPPIVIPTQLQHFIVDYDAPRSQAELLLMAQNALPLPLPKPASLPASSRPQYPPEEQDFPPLLNAAPLAV